MTSRARSSLVGLFVAVACTLAPAAYAAPITPPPCAVTTTADPPTIAAIAPASVKPLARSTTIGMDTALVVHATSPMPTGYQFLIPLLGFALIGAVKSVTADKDTYPVGQTTRQQHNNVVKDLYYFLLNGVASVTTATLPQCAQATNTTGIKTSQNTVVRNNGILAAFNAIDPAWTLTGGVLAASSFRKYLLLIDAAGVKTVIASNDATAAASCVFNALPAAGQAIVGQATIATDATHTFTPATTSLTATGITTTLIDGFDDTSFQSAIVNP